MRHLLRPSRVLAAIAAVAVAAAWLTFFPPRWWLNLTKPVDLADAVGTGSLLVAQYECHRCHLIDGEGRAKGPNLAGVTKRLDIVSLRLWLRDPRGIKWRTPMPNFQLSDSEIEAIVAYLMALDGEGS